MTRDDLLRWLREAGEDRLAELWRRADAARRAGVGDAVHFRGLIELSNHCVRLCAYCGLRASHRALTRYRMSAREILACARQATAFGYGTVVLQSGEDPGLRCAWVADLVRRIKGETPLAVTLSLGERSERALARWRAAGADRYLLRFETSNRALYDRMHPPRGGRRSDRPALLRALRAMGYEIGGGSMVGIPGQRYEDLAGDLELMRSLDLDMIGIGPDLPHPATPMGRRAERWAAPPGEQVPNDEQTTLRMLALARIVCPRANIPSTTALATLNRASGRELGLRRGANVVMPNLTPPVYRAHYEIYPDKACIHETAVECRDCLAARVKALGRPIGRGRGDAPRAAAARRSAAPAGTQPCKGERDT